MNIILRYARSPLAFIPFVAIACHLAFSWQGIVLSDDGFVLAVSKRLLHGEIPHRDFIFVRPIGSGLLHAPLLAIAGDYAIWAIRFVVWLQLSAIAWLWVAIMEKALHVRLPDAQGLCLLIACFAFGVHNHPILPWYTIDGLFLVSLGTYLSLNERSTIRMIGYIFAGGAALCKQNFIAVPALLPFFSGEARWWRTWAGVLLLPTAYGAWMLCYGGIEDFIAQMSAQTGVVKYGILPLIRVYTAPIGAILGFVGAEFLHRGRSNVTFRWIGTALLLAIPTSVAAVLGVIVGYSYFGLFGIVCGLLLWAYIRNQQAIAALLGFTALIAWSTAVSIGYNTPALAGGALLVSVIGALCLSPAVRDDANIRRTVSTYIIVLAIISGSLLVIARRDRLAYELPASRVTSELRGIVPGGAGIWTNPNTAALLKDAREAIALTNGTSYTFVPGLPIAWIVSMDKNFLPSDWPFRTEIPTPDLQQRVLDAFTANPGGIIIVSKVNHAVANGFQTIDVTTDPTFQPILRYVLEHGRLVRETKFFALYVLE